MVNETDATLCISVCVEETLPCSVKGIVTENWPPKATESVLLNHSAEAWVRSMLTAVMDTLKPGAAVNCAASPLNERVVEKPVKVSTKLLAAELVTWPAINVGADAGTVKLNVVGWLGVRFTPPAWVVNEGVKVIVVATVPVCSWICCPCPANTACSPFAGMEKLTERPPVENCTAGSVGRLPNAASVSVPAIAMG